MKDCENNHQNGCIFRTKENIKMDANDTGKKPWWKIYKAWRHKKQIRCTTCLGYHWSQLNEHPRTRQIFSKHNEVHLKSTRNTTITTGQYLALDSCEIDPVIQLLSIICTFISCDGVHCACSQLRSVYDIQYIAFSITEAGSELPRNPFVNLICNCNFAVKPPKNKKNKNFW